MSYRTIPIALGLILFSGCAEKRAKAYIAQLEHPQIEVRRNASYNLVGIGSSAVEPLIASAAQGSDSLRYIAAQILGRIGDRRALSFLRQQSNAANPHLRKEAVLALGKMGDPRQMTPLVDKMAADPSPQVRAAAAQSLANFRDTTAVLPLVAALDDSAAPVRRSALSALHRIWRPAAGPAVTRRLQDPDTTVRYIAVQTLGLKRFGPAFDGLVAALGDSAQPVRGEAALALQRLGDRRAVDPLVELLQNGNAADGAAARQALKELTGMDYVLLP